MYICMQNIDEIEYVLFFFNLLKIAWWQCVHQIIYENIEGVHGIKNISTIGFYNVKCKSKIVNKVWKSRILDECTKFDDFIFYWK